MNYRLTGEYWPWDTQRPQLDAVEDVCAAVRFVRSIAEQQHLDTDRIMLAGESAGAIAGLYLGYTKIAHY